MTAQAFLASGGVTSIGSLPHRDADAASEFVLKHSPSLPAAPQLPRRSPLEGMVAQAARGIAGVTVDGEGRLTVDRARLDPEAPTVPMFDGAGHGGLLAFLSHVAGRTEPVKIQMTGPVTLGCALVEAGADADVAFTIASSAVRAQGRALLDLVRHRLPDAPLVAFLDEPSLMDVGDGCRVSLTADTTIDLISTGLAALEGVAVTGVHCCGSSDLRLVAAAGPDIISIPADEDVVMPAANVLTSHLERGGWVAWGAIPTSKPLGTDPDRLWRRLSLLWRDLVQAGADPVLLRSHALITPECGLAGHGVSQAARALRMAKTLSDRVVDQAAANQRVVGA
ncbi:MAG: hypothetical protein QOI47_50 [Actinomycetota bacterium]|nr:hypothetical protein [Actinomycetota bacterium]